MWYAAHAIFYFRLKGRVRQGYFLVHENVYLVRAASSKKAMEKARVIAKGYCSSDSTIRIDDRPATMVFGGIRKLISVLHRGRGQVLHMGDEITYSSFHLSDRASVRKLVTGKAVAVLYVD